MELLTLTLLLPLPMLMLFTFALPLGFTAEFGIITLELDLTLPCGFSLGVCADLAVADVVEAESEGDAEDVEGDFRLECCLRASRALRRGKMPLESDLGNVSIYCWHLKGDAKVEELEGGMWKFRGVKPC